MPKVIDKLLAFEEATLGRVISINGLKFLGAAIVTGEVLHHATEAWKNRNDEHSKQLREQPSFEEYKPLDAGDFYSPLADSKVEK